MPIYFRPGGNDANGGTNATTDAKRTLVACLPLINLANPDTREVIACADTMGGTAIFTTASEYTFYNDNESVFPVPINEAQRLTFKGREGDTIKFAWTSSGFGWLWRTKCSYVTFFNMEFIETNLTTGSDAFRWFTQIGTDLVFVYLYDLIFRDNPQGHNCGSMSPFSRYNQMINCESYNAGMGNTGLANNFYWQGRDHIIRGNISDRTIVPADAQKGGIRCYTNNENIIAGEPESANNLIEQNFSARSPNNYTFAGNAIIVKNNVSRMARNNHFEAFEQTDGTNTGLKFLNNTGSGQELANVKGLDFFRGIYTQVEVDNNIMFGMTTPFSYTGIIGTVVPLSQDNNLTTDPSFLDEANDNLRIGAGSAARNAGKFRAEVTNDFDGNPRPSGGVLDIGAYEYQEAVINPRRKPYMFFRGVLLG